MNFHVPVEYSMVQTTELEEDLRQAVQGPDAEWLDSAPKGPIVHQVPVTDLPEEAQRRDQLYTKLERGDLLSPFAGASDHFLSYVKARLVQHLEAGREPGRPEVDSILEDAQQQGGRRLAEEAELMAARLGERSRRAGADTPMDVEFEIPRWEEASQVSRVALQVEGQRWELLDYGDQLEAPIRPS